MDGRMPARTTDEAEILPCRSTAGRCFGCFIDLLLIVDVQRSDVMAKSSLERALGANLFDVHTTRLWPATDEFGARARASGGSD
jgi:hypothetical protein